MSHHGLRPRRRHRPATAKRRQRRRPPWYTRPEARKALAERDIGAVYRLLYRDGVSQQEIARRTGQRPSEVWEIMHSGRQVRDITVLERIADGLGVPRPFLRLLADASGVDGQDGAYGGEVTVAGPPEGVSAEMLRRHVLALGRVAAFGAPVKGLGELLAKLGDPAPLALPSRLFEVHVAQVRELTQRLGEAGKAHGANPAVSSAAAAWGMRLLGVPGAEPLKRALLAAVAELQIHAGWAGSDAGLLRHAATINQLNSYWSSSGSLVTTRASRRNAVATLAVARVRPAELTATPFDQRSCQC